MIESGTLRDHAESVLSDAYVEARRQAADAKELSLGALPAENAWTLDDIVNDAD